MSDSTGLTASIHDSPILKSIEETIETDSILTMVIPASSASEMQTALKVVDTTISKKSEGFFFSKKRKATADACEWPAVKEKFIMTKSPSVTTFLCDACGKEKTSKTIFTNAKKSKIRHL